MKPTYKFGGVRKDPPERIFLQWDSHPGAEVTWCVDAVEIEGACNIEYVRADLAKETGNAAGDDSVLG